MSTRRAWSILFVVFLASVLVTGLAGLRLSSQDEPLDQETTIIPGRNVNMVSGTQLPEGDPWLQRQNEPSMAVSTRNPLHLLAGANDYRTVDMAMSEGGLPGKAQGAMAGDAWVGIYKSFDGGESWVTSLIPGFPQDQSAEGAASPLKLFSTAADPIVRAGTNGLFYYSGMAFNRDDAKSGGAIFLARFIDNNNVEELTQGDPIKYLDTQMIDVGNAGQFIDMPRIAADIPRGSGTVTVDGQTIPSGNVYCAYTVFLGNTDINIRSRMLFRRSTDCGATWGSAIKVSESQHIIQGATFAIDPRNGTIYIAFRRFLHPSQTDSIVVVRSTDFGQSFSSPVVIANINPFDQPATDLLGDDLVDPAGPSFRTNSYPTMAVDGDGIVYAAWTERGRGPAGEARIVMSTAQDGFGWTAATPIADTGGPNYQGHQFMPSLTFSQGKLVLVWYDQRFDEYAPLFGVGPWIGDGMPVRHTTDVRCAQADPELVPDFQTSVQVSKYLWALLPGTDDMLEQQQFNPPNFELFRGGTTPFHGDYIEVAAAPAFVQGENGWEYNIAPSPSPVFHAVWTDNRDVRPPSDGDWTSYTPPASAQGVFGEKTCGSVDLDSMGMRNQNIYTSALIGGVVAASPGNSKELGDLGTYYDPGDGLIPRAFVIYVQNPGQDIKVFRLTIDPEPVDVDASFLEFENLDTLDVMIAPFSTIARTVFVRAPESYAAVTLSVVEIDDLDGAPVPDGLTASVTLNPDPTSPAYSPDEEYHNPNIRNMEIVSWADLNNNLANPNIRNPNIRNWDEMNSSIVNPNIRNTDIDNPNIRNTVVNPNIRNSQVANPNIRNWNIVNPNIRNPNIRNYTEPEFDGAEISDAVFNIKNEGNTTSTYTLKTYSKEALPDEVYAQLLVYRVHYTPSADYYQQTDVDCELKVERHHELLLNVTNPNIRNPNCANPNIRNPNIRNGGLENATFAVPPGEEVEAVLRIIDFAPGSFDELRIMQTGEVFSAQAFVESIGFAATAHAYNTDEARTTPKEDLSPKTTATKLVISTSSLPYGIVGVPYEAELAADGGDVYVWSLNSGELPPGLALGASGLVSGTPTMAGFYPFIVRVDSGGDFDTQRFSIYIDADATADPLTITTTSLPSGVLQKWYGATLEATGGVWPLTWSLYSGRLPMGLSLDSSGVISGNIEPEPEDYPRTFNFEVVVTDGAGYSSAPRALGIVVNPWTGTYMTISGVVYSTGGTPLDGVVMRGLPNTPVTGMNGSPGYYEDEVPYLWSGTVIPFYAGQAFTPMSRTYSVLSSDMPNEDYNTGAVIATVIELTGPTSAGAGFISEALTVVSQNSSGYPVNVSTDTLFNLISDSVGTGIFYADPAGTIPISQVTIPADHNSADFYYSDNVGGNPILTATWASGGADLGLASHELTSWPVLGQIAFVSERDGNSEIYIMNPDGSDVRRLTNHEGADQMPCWSPLGAKFAFITNRDGNFEIYVMNADGSRAERLTDDPAYDGEPIWSPDEDHIAFSSNRDGDFEIYVMNADGSGQINITNHSARDVNPNWSPDGTKIAFASDRDGDAEVFVMNSDGSGLVKLTDNLVGDGNPCWCPDGSKIAFISGVPGSYDIYVMNADGSSILRLTEDSANEFNPVWSPDGSRLAFLSNRDGNWEVYIMNADGTGQANLTNDVYDDSNVNWGGSKIWFTSARDGNREIYFMGPDGSGQTRVIGSPNDDQNPRLSPDSTRIVFVSTRDGNYEIYAMNIDGSTVLRLTNNAALDTSPCWSPDGSRIVFTSQRDGDREIYSMNADGTDVTRLTYQDGMDDEPNWSPDGSRIVFASRRSGSGYDIYTMNSDGSAQIQLTTTNDEYVPSWSPDGSKIAFRSSRDGNAEIYVMNADGTGQTRLTSNTVFDDEPRWSPDGNKIAFTSYRDGNSEIYIMNADGTNVLRATENSALDAFFSWGAQPRGVHETYEFVLKWGSLGSGDGQLSYPAGIAIDGSDEVYVVEGENDRVQKFDSSGTFITKWGSEGTGDGQFNQPYGVAVDSSGHVYVLDQGNNRIQEFDSSGTFITKWGSEGTGDGQFSFPRGIAVDNSGHLYVADFGNHRIQKFTLDGTFVTKWGSSGTEDGQFFRPSGIAVDSSGNVYVSDYNHRVQKFTADGTFLSKWGTEGGGDGQFNVPFGISVDASGYVYVVDYNHRVQKFGPMGTFVTNWGSYGTADGQFNIPYAIAFDSSVNVYVTDMWNHRVQKFQKK